MGCFLGCFGGAKDQKRRKRRISRGSPQTHRVQNAQQESELAAEKCGIIAEQIITETPPTNVVSELGNTLEAEEQLSPSPRKRVTFNSNITAYDHVSISESIDSLPECITNIEKKVQEDLKKPSPSNSLSEGANSAISSVALYPPNHRYHNSRESDDESEEYGDSDLDDLDDLYEEDDYDDDNDGKTAGEEIVSESVLAASMESSTGNPSAEELNEEVESPNEEVKVFGSKTNTIDRSDYVISVLNPVVNQWKAAKSKGTYPLKPQKENLTSNFQSPCKSFSSEPMFKSKSDQSKNVNQEVAVDASLSNWLVTPEIKKASFSGLDTIASGKTTSEGSDSVKSFADRPILGALTVEELKQISVSSSPIKSPSRNPDEMPIIGTVGTYWSDSTSLKHSDSASSFKGIPNTTSKYREDKRVNWHSTPFETRLDRALNRVATES